MARPFLIIDGYNLMHSVGLARQTYGPGELEIRRHRLLRELASRLSTSAIARTTIVFDAFAADSDTDRHQSVQGLSVVYAPSGTDADSEIERLIAAHPAPKQLIVVSSDQRLHRAARRRRAQPVKSGAFWNGLDLNAAIEKETSARPARDKPDTAIVPPEFLDIDVPTDSGSANPLFDDDYLADLENELGDL